MKPEAVPVRESPPFRVLTGPPSVAGRERTVEGMDNRNEIRDFLTSRRARITPEQAGLPAYGGNRRVAGLRREEVALLAGVSIDYYTRLERGKANGVSESVLEGLVRALQLDEAERAHLFDLMRAANTATRPQRRSASSARQQVRPSVQRILDSMTTTPAYVRNDRLDILAANRLGRALFAPLFDSPARPANSARFFFLDPGAPEFYLDWERQAQEVVATLRSAAGRNPYDRALSNLIGELSTRSEAFRTWWAAHNVRLHRSGVKRLYHPVVGDLTLAYEALELSADPGLRISAYTAEPGTPSEDALNLLASWAATLDQAETATGLRNIDVDLCEVLTSFVWRRRKTLWAVRRDGRGSWPAC
jgi:transcriptional regulator with XRE-family HTH domain